MHRRGRVRRGPDGQARSVLGVALDITERKQAEEANARLAAHRLGGRRRHRRHDARRHHPVLEPGRRAPVRLSGRGMIGQSVRILYPEDADDEFERSTHACAPASTCATKACAMRRDGTPVHVSVVVTPVLARSGVAVGASAIVRDITERKRTEQQLVETLALLLQTSNQRKLALAAGGMGTFEVDIDHDRHHLVRRDLRPGRASRAARHAATAGHRTPSSIPTIWPRVHARAGPKPSQAAASTRTSSASFVRDGEVRWIYVRAQASPSRTSRPAHTASAWTSPSARSARRTFAS